MLSPRIDFEGLTGLGGLFEAVVVGGTPATDGMTLDATWDTGGQAYGDLSNATVCSMKATVTITAATEGLLMESGANFRGIAWYFYQGTIYIQAGKGLLNGTVGDDTVEASAAIPGSGTYVVEVSLNASISPAKAAIYIDGAVQGTGTATNVSSLSAGNNGTVLQTNQNPPLGQAPSHSNFDGTLDDGVYIYIGESTPEAS